MDGRRAPLNVNADSREDQVRGLNEGVVVVDREQHWRKKRRIFEFTLSIGKGYNGNIP